MRPYAIGIDLGTTYTAAAVWRDGRAEIVSLGDQGLSVPSVLFLREDGVFLVGDVALERGVAEPDRMAQDFKRYFGEQNAPMLLGEEEFEPARLLGHLLGWVVGRVVQQEGGPPEHVTLTCPATWGEYRRELLRQAAESAKLTSVGLLVEPIAAAVHYATQERVNEGAIVAVYDLGGGTFDATIVEKTTDSFLIRGTPVGDETIGGRDFDASVMHHVETVLRVPWRNWDQTDPVVLAGLSHVRNRSVTAKERLSSDTHAEISVILPELARNVRITRGEFESAIRLEIYKTISLLIQAIEDNGLDRTDLSAVLLIGGSSRIPLVAQLLTAEIGVPIMMDTHPKYAVCLGAAVSSSLRLPQPQTPPRTAPSTASSYVEAGQQESNRLEGSAVEPDPPVVRAPELSAPALPVADPPLDSDAMPLPPEEEAPTVDASGQQIGVLVPVDVRIEVHPDDAAPAPIVTDLDEPLLAEYSGVNRSWRIPLAVLGVVVVLVAASVFVAALGSRPATPPSDDAPDPSGSARSEMRTGRPVSLERQQVSGADGSTMNGVTRTPTGGVVAVGALLTDKPASHTPRVWQLGPTGWKPVFTDEKAGAEMNGVAAGQRPDEAGLVAAGWSTRLGSRDPADKRDRVGTIWTSPDGRSWLRASVPSSVSELYDVSSLPRGGFIATGVDWATDPVDGDGVILTSPTGQDWTVLATTGLTGAGAARIRRLMPLRDGGMLGIGSASVGAVARSTLWFGSNDGATWSSSREQFRSPDGRSATALGLAELSSEVLVVGEQADQGVASWTTAGLPKPGKASVTFRPAEEPGRMSGVVQTPSGLVGVGQTTAGTGRRASAWELAVG